MCQMTVAVVDHGKSARHFQWYSILNKLEFHAPRHTSLICKTQNAARKEDVSHMSLLQLLAARLIYMTIVAIFNISFLKPL